MASTLFLATVALLSPGSTFVQGPAKAPQGAPAAAAPALNVPVRLGPYQLTVTGAEFATRVSVADQTLVAEKGQKFLLVNYAVQNPAAADLQYDWGSLTFTVVGADTKNYPMVDGVFNPENMTPVAVEIKTKQKIPLVAVIPVPADDPIHKLMVRQGEGPSLRYDLRGKVKKFAGTYAGADGVKAVDDANAAIGKPFELGPIDISVDSVADVTSQLGESAPEEGRKYVVVHMTFRNPTKQAQNVGWDTFSPTLTDANDEPLEYAQMLLRGTGNEGFSQDIAPGQSAKVRMVFHAAKEAKPTKLVLRHGEGRSTTVKLP